MKNLFLVILIILIASDSFAQRRFADINFGISDPTFNDTVTETFVNGNQQVSAEGFSESLSGIGFAYLYHFQTSLLLEADFRYQNTSLTGSEEWRVRYIVGDEEREFFTSIGYVKSNIGVGVGFPIHFDSPYFIGFIFGGNMEYGHKLSEIDLENEFEENISNVNSRYSLNDDFLIGYYAKIKLGLRLLKLDNENSIFLTFTPSIQRSWKVYDEETESIDGFTGTRQRLGPSIGTTDAIVGISFVKRLYKAVGPAGSPTIYY